MKTRTLARVAAEKAAVLFEHFGWTYTQKGGQRVDPFVPNVDDLESTIDRLIDCLDGTTSAAGSGRFHVQRHDYENGEGTRVWLDLGQTNVYTGEVME